MLKRTQPTGIFTLMLLSVLCAMLVACEPERITIHQIGDVDEASDLPIEFSANETEVIVERNVSRETSYLVHNISDEPITVMAAYEVIPVEYGEDLDVLECFCYKEITLQPDEERILPIVFNVRPDALEGVSEVTTNFIFYSMDQFPDVDLNELN